MENFTKINQEDSGTKIHNIGLNNLLQWEKTWLKN